MHWDSDAFADINVFKVKKVIILKKYDYFKKCRISFATNMQVVFF